MYAHWRDLFVRLLLLAITLSPGAAGAAGPAAGSPFLAGQFLVASPGIGDPRFARTVIFIIDHDQGGAMGLVLNRSLGRGPLRALLQGFGVDEVEADGTVELHSGGPVDPTRGFVLHSIDFAGVGTRPVGEDVALSVGFDVLTAMASGAGPKRRQIYLGYAGWGPGQLESEIARNDWLSAPADTALIFTDDAEPVWDRAMRHAGMSL